MANVFFSTKRSTFLSPLPPAVLAANFAALDLLDRASNWIDIVPRGELGGTYAYEVIFESNILPLTSNDDEKVARFLASILAAGESFEFYVWDTEARGEGYRIAPHRVEKLELRWIDIGHI